MSAQVIQITDDTALPLIFYKDQPVLTFALIDKAHGRPEGTAKDRFNSNRKHFIEGEDWHRIDFA
ncbi:ORF6N domain-containing protein [Methylomagnum ishizawai]|uniref:ORF6N domain-containing protein n=1 Tax=Methylomagnum ishizawai TaxID=1760988 RepID=UPI000F73F5EA|nr:ORF6N domain-containing protein [Methylomagnum ishizawai]